MSAELEKRVLRKISLRIVPFIMLLYFIAFIDRVNIGFAALTMNKDLGFSPAVFGLGAGIFFSLVLHLRDLYVKAGEASFHFPQPPAGFFAGLPGFFKPLLNQLTAVFEYARQLFLEQPANEEKHNGKVEDHTQPVGNIQ